MADATAPAGGQPAPGAGVLPANGAGAPPEPTIPKSRYDEAVGRERAGREAAEKRAAQAEARWQEISRKIDERLPPPKPVDDDEDDDLDPSGRLAKEAIKLAKENADALASMRKDSAIREAGAAIASAVDAAGFVGRDQARERLAERWWVSVANGQTFDLNAEVAKVLKDEKDLLGDAHQERVNNLKRNEAATSSAMTGGGGVTTTATPKRSTRPVAKSGEEWASAEHQKALRAWEAAEWDEFRRQAHTEAE